MDDYFKESRAAFDKAFDLIEKHNIDIYEVLRNMWENNVSIPFELLEAVECEIGEECERAD